jgi:6-pyruvoyltetrahydropterin/6-carboxytetrahydropterin synthase
MKTCIGKIFEFEACHKLPDADIYGKCRNLHGHRYELLVEVCGDVNQYGWVCDFKTIKEIIEKKVLSKYDHAYLNDFFEIPTVEIIAASIFNDLSNALKDEVFEINKIRLFETSTSYVEIVK